MRKRTVSASIGMAALAVAGVVASGTAVSAAPATTAAAWDCSPKWYDDDLQGLIVTCAYGGKVRGQAVFWRSWEPEHLIADDTAVDNRAVVAEATWTQNGRERRSTVRSPGPAVEKDVAVPEGTKVWLRLCLVGHSCTKSYAVYA